MNCGNENCCKHGDCIKNGHDVESVMGHGFGTMCKKCGEVGLPLPPYRNKPFMGKPPIQFEVI